MHDFLHGINHSGWNGIAPLLVVGCSIERDDFVVRDLSSIQGVVIRQRGLEKGLMWDDLGMELLASKLPNLQLVDIEYADKCDVSVFGQQPAVTHLNLNCPKLRQKSDCKQFINATHVELRIPDQYLDQLLSKNIENLLIGAPKFVSLKALEEHRFLKKLVIQYARNLKTLDGIENFPNLLEAVFTDCPNLLEVGNEFDKSNIQKILLSGVRRLVNIDGLSKAKYLVDAKVILASKELVIPSTIQSLLKLKQL
jgi:hypothetical protein